MGLIYEKIARFVVMGFSVYLISWAACGAEHPSNPPQRDPHEHAIEWDLGHKHMRFVFEPRGRPGWGRVEIIDKASAHITQVLKGDLYEIGLTGPVSTELAQTMRSQYVRPVTLTSRDNKNHGVILHGSFGSAANTGDTLQLSLYFIDQDGKFAAFETPSRINLSAGIEIEKHGTKDPIYTLDFHQRAPQGTFPGMSMALTYDPSHKGFRSLIEAADRNPLKRAGTLVQGDKILFPNGKEASINELRTEGGIAWLPSMQAPETNTAGTSKAENSSARNPGSAGSEHAEGEAHAPIDMKARFKDPEFRASLKTLEPELNKQVIGQPDLISTIAKATRANAVDPGTAKPVSALLLGSTGIGKTETSKAITRVWYKNKQAFLQIDMGAITHSSHLTSIFGGAKGWDGGKTPGILEKFFIDHPSGVVLFDEIGNVPEKDGSGVQLADTVRKNFYKMMDEGKWTNNEGKDYLLGNYHFIFTSNEGQEFFDGLSTDDLRISRWKDMNNEEALTAFLKKKGWPEALLARFRGRVALAKPLVSSERIEVAKLMVNDVIGPFQKAHDVKVTFDPEFYHVMGDSFFSHTQGARAMEKVAGDELKSAMGNELLSLYEEHPDQVEQAHIHFTLKDNFLNRSPRQGEERKVVLSTEVTLPHTSPERREYELTKKAVKIDLKDMREKVITAFHEAAHAVVNEPKESGFLVERITINGSGDQAGYVSFAKGPATRLDGTRQQAVSRMAGLLAGGMAEEKLLPNRGLSSGASSDKKKMRAIAEDAIVNRGLSEDAIYYPSQNGQVIAHDPAVQHDIKAIIKEAENLARKRVDQRWQEIRNVAKQVIRSNGMLDPVEFEAARNSHSSLADCLRAGIASKLK